MTTAITYDNPYWDAVRDHVHEEERHPWDRGPFVGGYRGDDGAKMYTRRHDLTSQYAWTITDPATVAFVTEHCGPSVIDPLAGTGYWAWLLAQHGLDVAASDINPPDGDGNTWHREGNVFVPVVKADAVDAVTVHGDGRTLLLSWPPYDADIGHDVLKAYTGERVVYIGEGSGGCCGDEAMWSALESEWVEVVDHKPVQWFGLHDWVTVYERKAVER